MTTTTTTTAKTLDFKPFKAAVAKQFDLMQKHPLFRMTTEKDKLWETYLGSFPEGTNPIYKERTEHDCNCCRSFVKAVGNVVALIDGKVVSIWDIKIDGPYQVVADALSTLVKADAIANIFLHSESKAGVDKNFQELLGESITWQHFFINLPARVVNKDPGSQLGDTRATHDVMLRSLTEITSDAIETVLDLIAQNSLYKGEEQKFAVAKLQNLKRDFDKLASDREKDIFVWNQMKDIPQSVSRIRNTAVGTLLTDLSEGVDLEAAVKSFESKVAPANYKRPKALVSPKMVEKAKEAIEGLGLMSAMSRRYANLSDITINNLFFVNRDVKKNLAGNVFDDIAASIPVSTKPKTLDKIEEISIEKFISDVVPRAESIEVLVENRHVPNLVSLIAPEDPTAGQLFKWSNNFSWAYNGEVADSDLRQAVQARGGRVDGAFRFSHSWNHPGQRNASLMDLHVFMPGHKGEEGQGHGGYGGVERVGWNHRKHPRSGGVQDVDFVQAAHEGFIPVENITFPDLKRMPEGTYVCKIHNWQLRHPTQGGFKAEIEFGGQVFQYEYLKPLAQGEWITVAEVTLKNGQFSIKHRLPEATSSKTVWGLQTETFHKVNAIMHSPNHWDEQGVGNRHYMFMLEGCVNEGSARGFFNEMLRSDLDPHRKAFELVGSKMRTAETDNQLSGLGFSSTQKNHVIVRVKGAFTRQLKVTL